VQALTLGKPSSDAEWRLGVGLGQHGAAITVTKGEIEPGVPADDRAWPLVATTRGGLGKSRFPSYAWIDGS
jgi:hypothetical protein